MWIQKSYRENTGTLYIVPTPIGNLEDITLRALRILQEVDWIAAEDTRQTKKITNHFEISTPLFSYHEHNKYASGEKIITYLENGESIALVSDAGMPGISDPGFDIIASCIQKQFPVIPLPGANAALPSIVASGLPTDHFYFHGFLPRDKRSKKKEIETLKTLPFPIIFYESPHRLKETVTLLNDVFGDRMMSVTRELSKKYEEFIRGSINEIVDWVTKSEIKGEFCLIIEGCNETLPDTTSWWEDLSVVAHVENYIERDGMDSKAAIKKTAIDRGVPKREIYNIYHTRDDE